MNFVAQSNAQWAYHWENDVAPDPALTDGSFSSGSLTQTGASAPLQYLYDFSGAYVNLNLNLSPTVQKVFMSAFAPTAGTFQPEATLPNHTITGRAFLSFDYGYLDYAPVTGSKPITVAISYQLDINGFASVPALHYSVMVDSFSPTDVFSSLGGFSGGIAGDNIFRPSGALQVTLAPGSTLALKFGLDASIGSFATTLNSYPTTEAPLSFLDLSHTGLLKVQEVDGSGNAIVGNPDLQFVGGAQFGLPPAPVPVPASLLLLSSILPIALLLKRSHHSNASSF